MILRLQKRTNLVSNTPKLFCRGSAPKPAGEAYSAPLVPLAGGVGAASPLSKNSNPAVSPSASSFGSPGLAGSSPHYLNSSMLTE